MISRYRNKFFVLALCFPCLIGALFAGERGVPASEGIGNFGKINDALYRGAQPDVASIKSLKALGVKTIINLRVAKNALPMEKIEARANGIAYTNIPLAGLGRPSDAEITQILSLIANSPGPVFVHCEHGCDRTGTIIACYRIQHDHWSGTEALAEAEKYGISSYERGMRQYIRDFAAANRHQNKPGIPVKP